MTPAKCQACADCQELLYRFWPDYDYLRLAARIALTGRHWHLSR